MKKIFASRLRFSRERLKISQRKAAGRLGVSPALLSHYENGAREYGLEFLCRAADYYDVSVDFLLGRTVQIKEELIDPDIEADDKVLKKSMTGTLAQKLLQDSMSVIFTLCDEVSPDMTKETFEYFCALLYRYWNFSFGPNFEIPVAVSQVDCAYITAHMLSRSEAAIIKEMAVRWDETKPLPENIPATYTSFLNVLSRADKNAAALK